MLKKLTIAAALTVLAAGPALANHLITVSWTGKISGGTDDLGTFGAAGADMTGADFTSSFVFDVTVASYQLGTLTEGSFVYPFFSDYQGGVISSSFTLNGQTIAVGGNGYTDLYTHHDPQALFGGDLSELDADASGVIGNAYTALFQRISQGPDEPWADLNFGDYDGDVSGATSDPDSNFFVLQNLTTQAYEQLTLTNQHVTIVNSVTATPSPTPEPASWAMMLGGFGLIGGVLRSRRRVAVAFA